MDRPLGRESPPPRFGCRLGPTRPCSWRHPHALPPARRPRSTRPLLARSRLPKGFDALETLVSMNRKCYESVMRLDLARAKSSLAATQGTFPPVSPAGRPVAAPERTDEREAPGTHKQVSSATGLHGERGGGAKAWQNTWNGNQGGTGLLASRCPADDGARCPQEGSPVARVTQQRIEERIARPDLFRGLPAPFLRRGRPDLNGPTVVSSGFAHDGFPRRRSAVDPDGVDPPQVACR